ncbi:transglutaminase family protein, partial [Agrobacterium sp. S2]|nr:transglutaminase family protein [Agrobacterium sp. S2]
MLIRVGYEIAVEVTSPTAVYTYLNVHPEQQTNIVWSNAQQSFGTRHIDVYGNELHRHTLAPGETV